MLSYTLSWPWMLSYTFYWSWMLRDLLKLNKFKNPRKTRNGQTKSTPPPPPPPSVQFCFLKHVQNNRQNKQTPYIVTLYLACLDTLYWPWVIIVTLFIGLGCLFTLFFSRLMRVLGLVHGGGGDFPQTFGTKRFRKHVRECDVKIANVAVDSWLLRPDMFIDISMLIASYIALHCIALHCIALHCIALHCIALHCIALHCIALHCIALHCIALHCITLHYIALHCITLHFIALHCIALYCTPFRFIALHCIVLHCIILYCIVLHCIALH